MLNGDLYPIDTMCDGAHGTPVIHWPNRLADGRKVELWLDESYRVTEPKGTPGMVTVPLWLDESYRVTEPYTADILAPDRRWKALDTKPVACPPNAFASSDRVITSEPGRSMTTAWRAHLT
ncbi:MAG: hypothetical protein ACYDGY_07880 [Acidimicrobiales bacterium]